MKVMSGAAAEVRPGNCLPLSEIPVGTMVHNVELHAGKGGQLVRAAGNGAQLMAKEGKYATLQSSIRRDENGSDQLPRIHRCCWKWRAQPDQHW